MDNLRSLRGTVRYTNLLEAALAAASIVLDATGKPPAKPPAKPVTKPVAKDAAKAATGTSDNARPLKRKKCKATAESDELADVTPQDGLGGMAAFQLAGRPTPWTKNAIQCGVRTKPVPTTHA